jgi:hypothetical protein
MVYEVPPLQVIAAALEDEDYVCEFMPANSSRPIDVLLVSLGDVPDEPFIVEVTFPGDLLLAMGENESIDDAFVLQFLLRYRFSFQPEEASHLAFFLAALNRAVPVGAFGMDHETGTIFLQYALILPTRDVEQDVLGTILSSFDSFAPALAPLIQQVGGGRLSPEEAIAKLDELGFDLPPMLPGPASLIDPPAE